MTKIVLVGNAITASILYGYLRADERYEVAASVVDDAFAEKSQLGDLPCIPLSKLAGSFPSHSFHLLMAMGYAQVNSIRSSLFERLKEMGYVFETYIHPKAMICSEQQPGEGSVALPGALVEPGAQVGMDTFLWGNTVTAHDAVVGSHCWLAAGAVVSGMARVGDHSFVGVNATISNKVEVGESCIVGGAAFISKNIKANSVYLARSAEPFRCTAREYAIYFGM